MTEEEIASLTRANAETALVFVDESGRTWRRNGKTQVWKTRPEDFRIPVKWGLYTYDQITHLDAHKVSVVK